MGWQFSIYVLPLLFAAVLSALLATFVYRNRAKRTAPQIFGILVAAVVWSTADALRILSTDPATQVFWHNVRFAGSTLVVFAVFFHALEYTNREEWITRRSIAAVGSVFVATNVLVWTGLVVDHGLIHADFDVVDVGTLILVDFSFGPWFYLNAIYSYLLLIAVVGMYVQTALRLTGTYRLQAVGLIVGTLVPWAMNASYLLGYTPVDLTAFGFTIMGVIFVAQFYRFQLLDIIPIGRSTVINQIESGYLVLDTDGRIVDVNEAGAGLLDRSRESIIGESMAELLTDVPAVLEKFGGERDVRDDITLVEDGRPREYEVDISPIIDSHERDIGQVVLVRDVTTERQRERKLEQRTTALQRQNEKLEEFASIVSHDLRNPIAVAKGHLQIAREDGDSAGFDRVEEALGRMADITEDVLELARQERELTDVELVDLASLAEESWSTVDTGDATLVVETERRFDADAGRLRRVLENLFGNAVDHGGDDLTVRVGDLDGGFFVEDDGDGIDVEDRPHVFDSGFTTDDEGTGLGLTIVRAAADAHGWSVVVTESEAGGARFEFTDVVEPRTGEDGARRVDLVDG